LGVLLVAGLVAGLLLWQRTSRRRALAAWTAQLDAAQRDAATVHRLVVSLVAATTVQPGDWDYARAELTRVATPIASLAEAAPDETVADSVRRLRDTLAGVAAAVDAHMTLLMRRPPATEQEIAASVAAAQLRLDDLAAALPPPTPTSPTAPTAPTAPPPAAPDPDPARDPEGE
jgi:hypothetical protein